MVPLPFTVDGTKPSGSLNVLTSTPLLRWIDTETLALFGRYRLGTSDPALKNDSDLNKAERRAIATLDLPVLVVHGRQDPAALPAHATEVAAGFPRAGLRWVDACGHFPHLEHARVVNAWLAEFLIGRPAPR